MTCPLCLTVHQDFMEIGPFGVVSSRRGSIPFKLFPLRSIHIAESDPKENIQLPRNFKYQILRGDRTFPLYEMALHSCIKPEIIIEARPTLLYRHRNANKPHPTPPSFTPL